MKRRSIIAMSATLALVAGYLAISPVVKAKGDLRAHAAQASALLSQAATAALALRDDVYLLRTSYTESRMAPDDAVMASIRQHIGDMQALAAQLDAVAPDAELWQREVIAQVNPVLKELAGNTNSAVGFFDNANISLHETEFEEYLAASFSLAQEATTHIASEVDFGNTRNTFYDSYGRLLNALMAGLG